MSSAEALSASNASAAAGRGCAVARVPLRLAALALVLQFLCAFEIDPYHAQRVGTKLELPGRPLLLASAWLLLALALLLLAWPRVVSAVPALLAGANVALQACPSNSALFHLLGIAALATATLAVAVGCARGGAFARLITRLALVALVLLAAESAFATVARSHAVGYTLASRLWFARHWNPPGNAQGFRDVEHAEDGRPHLFVLGDSFVAGVGIADVSERFSDRLRERVGERYQVHNLGYNGADTRYELELLQSYPFKPALLVLSYYINDISNAAGALGHSVPPFRPYANLPWPIAWVVARSYLLDFLYWLRPQSDLASEARFLERCFTWPEVVAQHQADLQKIVDWARAHDCALIAVVFPSLPQLESSGPWIAPALATFAQNGVPIVDVAPLVRELAADERVVNANDSHPSSRVHALVAEALAARVAALER